MTAIPQGPTLLADEPILLAGIANAFEAGVAEGPFAILDRAAPSAESLAFWFGPAAEPIAFATMVDAGADTAWLDLLYVHPDHRRQGLAKALVRQCMASAREAGAARFCTGVSTDNLASTALMVGIGLTPGALVFGRDFA